MDFNVGGEDEKEDPQRVMKKVEQEEDGSDSSNPVQMLDATQVEEVDHELMNQSDIVNYDKANISQSN